VRVNLMVPVNLVQVGIQLWEELGAIGVGTQKMPHSFSFESTMRTEMII